MFPVMKPENTNGTTSTGTTSRSKRTMTLAALLLTVAAVSMYFLFSAPKLDERAFLELLHRYDQTAVERVPPGEVAQYVSQLSEYIEIISNDSSLGKDLKLRYLDEIRRKMYAFADAMRDRAGKENPPAQPGVKSEQ